MFPGGKYGASALGGAAGQHMGELSAAAQREEEEQAAMARSRSAFLRDIVFSTLLPDL